MTDPFSEFLLDLKVVGVEPSESVGCRFALVKARSNARWWLLPLDHRRAASAGLEMLQPVTLTATIAKAWTQAMSRFGPRRLIARQTILLDGKPDLGAQFNNELLEFAYFTGTAGPHRKTSIQIMDRDARILGYAKLSREGPVAKFIDGEVDFLKEIDQLRLKSAKVPEVLASRRSKKYSLLVTDTTSERRTNPVQAFGLKHLKFLNEVQGLTSQRGAEALCARLLNDVTVLRSYLSADWEKRLRHAISLLERYAPDMKVSYAHGDLTPWNCFETSYGLYVFDWEYGARNYPIGYDHLHFLISTCQRIKSEELVEYLERQLAPVWFGNDRRLTRTAMLLSLAIHAIFYLQRSHDAGDQSLRFDGEQLRGGLIDALTQRLVD